MIKVEIKGMQAAMANIKGLQKQVKFAASKAINATAKKVAEAMPAEIEASLDRPTPFTKNGVAVLSYANKGKLEATVGFRPIQAKYMQWQVEGGTYQPGPAGVKLPSAIQLNSFGNIPKGAIAQMIAHARKDKGMKKATAKRIKVSSKVDLYYGQPVVAGKEYPRGIYKAVNAALIPLVVFPTKAVTYKKRFDFHGKAKQIVEREWAGQFEKAMNEALASAR